MKKPFNENARSYKKITELMNLDDRDLSYQVVENGVNVVARNKELNTHIYFDDMEEISPMVKPLMLYALSGQQGNIGETMKHQSMKGSWRYHSDPENYIQNRTILRDIDGVINNLYVIDLADIFEKNETEDKIFCYGKVNFIFDIGSPYLGLLNKHGRLTTTTFILTFGEINRIYPGFMHRFLTAKSLGLLGNELMTYAKNETILFSENKLDVMLPTTNLS